jgi:hypothetical protein
MLKSIVNPDLYHGRGTYKNYFEGWYFKLVDPTEKYVFSFIPGIFYGEEASSSHSFIQVLNGNDKTYNYIRFPDSFFTASKDHFNIYIGNNNFSKRGLTLKLADGNLSVKGSVTFNKITIWPDSLLTPGSMGYYNYIPKMQCYSQVCAIDMSLSGNLVINGKSINFSGGKGYIEKNWGSSFPYSWIWVQANNFKKSSISLSCSIGHIPFLYTSFRGFLIGLSINNAFYKFTTMNKSIINIETSSNDVSIRVENNDLILLIQTETCLEDFLLCFGPRGKEMVPLVGENINGRTHITLIDKATKSIIAKDISHCSGIEYGGSQMQILDKH